MWVQPEITQKLYVGLWVAFIVSCLLPYKLMGFMIGEKFSLMRDNNFRFVGVFLEGGPKVSNFHLLLYAIFVGVYAGIKFFMIDFIFKSCPKLRDKYDTPYIVWANLPTDPQLKERNNASLSRRVSETVCRHIVPIWKACKISILNPLCRFVRRNSSVMTEMSNDFLL